MRRFVLLLIIYIVVVIALEGTSSLDSPESESVNELTSFFNPTIENTSNSTNSKITKDKSRGSKFKLALYSISCLGVFFFSLACFFCCKHFCCEGCRWQSSTYRQMEEGSFHNASIYSIQNGQSSQSENPNSNNSFILRALSVDNCILELVPLPFSPQLVN